MFGINIGSLVNVVSWTAFFAFFAKAMNALRTAITINVLLFLLGIIILYSISKFCQFKKPSVQVLPTNVTNLPVDYQDYLKHKQLDEQYNNDERFSIIKLFSGFAQGRNWAKALVIGVMICVMLIVGYSVTKELNTLFGKKQPPVVSTITNTGGGTVEAKTESKSEPKTSNGLNLNLFSGWF